MRRSRHWPLVLILVAYLIAGSLYATFTPDWQAPDEPAHYNYVRQVANGTMPLIEPGDYDQTYQAQVIASRFDSQYSVDTFEYEDYQPPLYYLLLAPIFLLTDGALESLRFISVLYGAGVILFAYVIAQRLFSGQPWLALTAAAFVAFLPQHVAMLAAVNNDSLAELLIAAILWLLLVQVGDSQLLSGGATEERKWVLLGFLLGLGFLTKVTVYIMAPVVGAALTWLYWGQWFRLRRAALAVLVPALLLGLIWWVRNLVVYGGLDVLGIAAHNDVVTGQPRTADWIADKGALPTLWAFLRTTFQSFWGQFGWMGVPMPVWVYGLLLLLSLLTAAGFGWHIRRWRLAGGKLLPSRAILGGTLLLSLLLYLAYNVTFVQHQGRYLFPGLIPVGLGVAAGLAALSRPLLDPLSRRQPRVVYLLPAGLAAALFGLDLLALFRFIVPSLS